MKTITSFLLCILGTLVFSNVATSQTALQKMEFTKVLTISKSYSASGTDTTPSSIIPIEGDSLGFVVEVLGDSVTTTSRIQYVSPAGFTDTTTIGYYTAAVASPNNAKAAFGAKIVPLCTQGWCKVWAIVKNNKASTQSVTVNVYRVRRR